MAVPLLDIYTMFSGRATQVQHSKPWIGAQVAPEQGAALLQPQLQQLLADVLSGRQTPVVEAGEPC